MSEFKIIGPATIAGEIKVLGAKNAAMKMVAASVLIPGKVVLKNVPEILDIETILEILAKNGAVITRDGHKLEIDTTNLTNASPDPAMVKKMRGSIVLMGPLLARFGQISIPQPGGCAIGCRPINIHLDIFRQFGAGIEIKDEIYTLKTDGLVGRPIHLSGISVTATENALMAAVGAEGETLITNAAQEPEIVDLANFLNFAGAKITGAGTDTIRVQKSQLKPVEYEVMPDKIEAATFITLGILTKGEIKVSNIRPKELILFLDKIKEMGASVEVGEDYVLVKDGAKLRAINLKTGPYPGFATDWQPLMGLLMTQAEGQSQINETVFENRLNYLNELKLMGAKVEILNNQEAKITGPTPLHGAYIESLDLRAGVTLLVAGLAAQGETNIFDAQTIDRGYEKIEERLVKVGAKIERL